MPKSDFDLKLPNIHLRINGLRGTILGLSALAAGTAVAGMGIAALYNSSEETKASIWEKVYTVLEKKTLNGVRDPEVKNVSTKCLYVELCCHTKKSFLEFRFDYESGKITRDLTEEFGKINIVDVTVQIENYEEVTKWKDSTEISKPESSTVAADTGNIEVQVHCYPELISTASSSELPVTEEPEKPITTVSTMAQKPYLPGPADMIRDIPFNLLMSIGILLNPQANKDFRMLAHLIGYSVDEIQTLELEENPTASLFADWGTNNRSTIGTLQEYLVGMGRDDVISVLHGKKPQISVRMEVMETDAPGRGPLVRDIDIPTRQKICNKMNRLEMLAGNDYRMFSEKVGVTPAELAAVSRHKNKMGIILNSWGTKNEATVDKMKQIMHEMGRDDVVTILDEYLLSIGAIR